MTRRALRLGAILVLALGLSAGAIAQFQRGRGSRGQVRTEGIDRGGLPTWANEERFKSDVFTFVRVRYPSWGRDGWYGPGDWSTDWPDSDLNFSYRLHELTSLRVDPNGKILDLSDEAIFDYPFLYLIEPGGMRLEEAEVQGLRRYLLNGGFLMVDDFWGEAEWTNFLQQIKRVFPDREPVELPLEHEIFHCVYDLKVKPQIPSIVFYMQGQTYERADARVPHYRAVFDDKGRMMAFICHNTDLGDGWEREGMREDYFREMSEKWAYPLGINIVTYAMTH